MGWKASANITLEPGEQLSRAADELKANSNSNS